MGKRQWLYHKDAEATIFTGDDAIEKAIQDGWVDTPAKLEQTTLDADIVDPLAGLKKDELIKLLVDKGIEDIPANATKAQLTEILKMQK